MLAVTMVVVDTTIANVALPHMQATMSASQDQIVWVLTSYLIVTAIATPLTGWLASRFGRRPVMILSTAGFTLASLLCGMSNSIGAIVLARALQGACGAALVPLSQATVLDTTPREGQAKAMAVYSLGTMVGPLIGPTLGGWLTDAFTWRWVFFINLPFGILALAGLVLFLPDDRDKAPSRFDMFGFATVSLALASFQLMIDRGEQLDWFDSTEVWTYAIILATAAYLGVVHVCTAKNTFIRVELFKDRNFAFGCLLSATIGFVTFASIPLVTVMMQHMLGYSAYRTGIVGLPRGIGTLLSILLVTQLIGKFPSRLLVFSGMTITSAGLFLYTRFDLYVDQQPLLWAGLIQGLGSGLMIVPLSIAVFATLPPVFRNEGATLYALTRNLGTSLGISLLQRQVTQNTAVVQSRLVEGVRPDSTNVQFGMPDMDFGSIAALARMKAEIVRQAGMVAYIDVYWLMSIVGVVMLPAALLMREPKRLSGAKPLPTLE